MDSTRQNKISRLIQKDLSELFQLNGKTWFSGKIVSVTVVRVSADLGVAKVYVSVFPKSDNDLATELNSMAREIRHLLAQRVKHQMRKVPELKFFYDDSIDYANRIDELLNDPS